MKCRQRLRIRIDAKTHTTIRAHIDTHIHNHSRFLDSNQTKSFFPTLLDTLNGINVHAEEGWLTRGRCTTEGRINYLQGLNMQFQEHITALGRSSQHIVISWKCLFISSGTLLEIYILLWAAANIWRKKIWFLYR